MLRYLLTMAIVGLIQIGIQFVLIQGRIERATGLPRIRGDLQYPEYLHVQRRCCLGLVVKNLYRQDRPPLERRLSASRPLRSKCLGLAPQRRRTS